MPAALNTDSSSSRRRARRSRSRLSRDAAAAELPSVSRILLMPVHCHVGATASQYVLTRPGQVVAGRSHPCAAHGGGESVQGCWMRFGIPVALTARLAVVEGFHEMSQAGLGLRLKQQLTLTPRLQQSVKLLQLSALECVQELNQAIAQNPFLEEPVEGAESRAEANEAGDESSSRSELEFPGASGGSSGGDETPDWTEWTASPSTLQDSLREQLLLLGLSERDYALANLVVDALDDDGFLRQPLEELAALVDHIDPGELETALRIVQTLEPAGVAARSLGECLSLQLQTLEAREPGRDIALDIVQTKIDLLAARDHSKL